MVPHHNCFRNNITVGGECGALELACSFNKVQVIVVIGHSDCKAMNLLYSIRNDLKSPSKGPLEDWLRVHGQGTVEQFRKLEDSIGISKKLKFAGAQHYEDDFEAFIDPYNQFQPSDRFSQVKLNWFLFSRKSIVSFILDKYIRTTKEFSFIPISKRAAQSK